MTSLSKRQLRVGELIRHELATYLIRDELYDLKGAKVTVSQVMVSPDLKIANVYIMPLGGGNQERIIEILAILKNNSKLLRTFLASKLNLKFTPTLRFVVDETFSYAAKIDALLQQPSVAGDLKS